MTVSKRKTALLAAQELCSTLGNKKLEGFIALSKTGTREWNTRMKAFCNCDLDTQDVYEIIRLIAGDKEDFLDKVVRSYTDHEVIEYLVKTKGTWFWRCLDERRNKKDM